MTQSNKIILGTVQFGLDYGINNRSGKPDRREVFSILDNAFKAGIKLLDTAEAYGDAQEVIGDYHAYSSSRFQVITKFGEKRNDLPASITDRILSDIRKMGLVSLYGYMYHSYSDFLKYYSKHIAEIKELKQKGILKKWGVSIYSNQELEALLQCQDIDLIQLPFNLLDNTNKRGKLLSAAKKKGIEIHTRSAFLQGLFFMDGTLPLRLNPLQPYLKAIKQTAQNAGLTLNALALGYALQQDVIDYVLIGVDNTQQLQANLIASSVQIPAEVFNEINKINVLEENLLSPANWNA